MNGLLSICFRPLRESFLFLYKLSEHEKRLEQLGFRPLRGSFLFLYKTPQTIVNWENGFRPLRGSFLFLSCPMETLPGLEKTCTLRCKKFSPAKSGDLKLFKCSVPRFYALRCKTMILLVLSSPSLDHKYDLAEGRLVLF